MKIQATSIIETKDGHRVHILLADALEEETASKKIVIDLPVEIRGYPPLPEFQKLVLQSARNVINDEIERIKRIASHKAD